jgi:hypothetical protein
MARPQALAAALVVLGLVLSACGGSDDDTPPPGATTADPRRATLAAPTIELTGAANTAGSAALVSPSMTLDWAQYRFPELFDARQAIDLPGVAHEGVIYDARAYPHAGGMRYLGITLDRRVFGLGDFTQDRLMAFETVDHWAPQVLQDWCAVRPADCAAPGPGYGQAPPVPPATQAIDETVFSDSGAALAVALQDGSRVEIGGQPGAFGAQLEREAGTDAGLQAALATRPGLRITGSARGLYILGAQDVSGLLPRMVVPAAEAAGLNPDTLVAVRVGPAVVNGQMVQSHVSVLPVQRDAAGRLSFVDPLFRDGLYPMSDEARPGTGPAQRMQALNARRPRAAPAVEYAWIGGARYVLATFQDDLDWQREPRLVRVVPDAARAARGWRRPVTASERAALARQPLCQIVLLVHGHNEEEKAGEEDISEPEPWRHTYKRRVWDVLFEKTLAEGPDGSARYPQACTAFYEFIYPTYRPIFSPVSAKGAGVQETLGEALGRLMAQELQSDPQLARLVNTGQALEAVVVAHSQGGLVARAGLRFMPEAFKSRVRRLVTWGSPHHGAAIYSMRYAMLAGHDLVVDGMRLPLQNLVQGEIAAMALDTPGIRDLRLDATHQGKFRWQAMFPTLNPAAQAALSPGLFSTQLAEFNRNIATREIDPGPHYVFLTGTKRSSARLEPEQSDSGWWLQFRRQQVARFAASSGTEQGAALNQRLMASGFQASDGAVPLFSQQAAGLWGPESFDVGDIDHEEFYGAEPPLRQAASLAKARLVAEHTFDKSGWGAAAQACPSLQGLALKSTADALTVEGRLHWPALATRPGRTGAWIARIEARAGSRDGAPLPGVVFQHDADGRFVGRAAAAAIPAGPLTVVAVLQDGSEVAGALEHAGASDFVAVRLFDQPWVITENREGVLRATLDRLSGGSRLQCTLSMEWALPRSHSAPLTVRLVRLLQVDGTVRNDSFFVRMVSYGGRVFPVGDGRHASRNGTLIDPTASLVRTAQGIQREFSYLAPERIEAGPYDKRPTLYLEVQGLCGGSDTTPIRVDYATR